MKKKLLFLAMSLCILMLASGCGKKDETSEPDKNETITEDKAADKEAGTTDEAPLVTSAPEAEVPAPVKEKYVVSDYITLGQYKGIKVTVDKLVVTEEDIDAAIQADLEANAVDEEVKGRPVKDGDIVNIDYEGLKDGVAFEGGTAQAYDLTIGSGAFIEGFEEQIIGAKVGDKLKLDVTFPQGYQEPTLAGQPVVFNVTVNAIKKTVVPELTVDYVKENTEFDTIEAYKVNNRKVLEENNAKTMNDAKIKSVLSTVVENATISSYPQTLIDYYSFEMKDYYTQYASMYGMGFADFLAQSGMTQESFDVEAKAYAESRASQELVLSAIIEVEGIKLSDKEYEDGIAQILTDYGYASEEELLATASEDQIRESLLWEKVIAFVTEQAFEL